MVPIFCGLGVIGKLSSSSWNVVAGRLSVLWVGLGRLNTDGSVSSSLGLSDIGTGGPLVVSMGRVVTLGSADGAGSPEAWNRRSLLSALSSEEVSVHRSRDDEAYDEETSEDESVSDVEVGTGMPTGFSGSSVLSDRFGVFRALGFRLPARLLCGTTLTVKSG